jgi:hypothetical protein
VWAVVVDERWYVAVAGGSLPDVEELARLGLEVQAVAELGDARVFTGRGDGVEWWPPWRARRELAGAQRRGV